MYSHLRRFSEALLSSEEIPGVMMRTSRKEIVNCRKRQIKFRYKSFLKESQTSDNP